MVSVSASVTVSLPCEGVFKSVCDPETHLKWESSTLKINKMSPGPIALGTRHQGVVKLLGLQYKWDSEVDEFDIGRKIDFRIATSAGSFKESWSVEPVIDGSRVTFNFVGDLRGYSKLVTPLLVYAWQKQCDRDLVAMKNVLESKV